MNEIQKSLHELYNMAKWKVQKDYVDKLKFKDRKEWLIEVNKVFDRIETDRKDKFYYLIDQLASQVDDYEFICKLTNIRDYIICNFLHNFKSCEILKYIENYKIFDFKLFAKIDFDIEKVEEILKNTKVINRDFLSEYYLARTNNKI